MKKKIHEIIMDNFGMFIDILNNKKYKRSIFL